MEDEVGLTTQCELCVYLRLYPDWATDIKIIILQLLRIRPFHGCFWNYEFVYIFGRTPWAGISSMQGLYLWKSSQHRKTRAFLHASIGIRTYEPSIWAVDTHNLDHAATEDINITDTKWVIFIFSPNYLPSRT
jgi:hypothetical protein